MVRGWHIHFYEKHHREDVLKELRKIKSSDIYKLVAPEIIMFKEVPTQVELMEYCEKYSIIPSEDATIRLTEASEAPKYSVMQLASGGGISRKIKNILRRTILFEMMKIADELEICYMCTVG